MERRNHSDLQLPRQVTPKPSPHDPSRSRLADRRRSFAQILQCERRLAFNVLQPAHRMYIACVNRFVITALNTRIPPRTAIVTTVSQNLFILVGE